VSLAMVGFVDILGFSDLVGKVTTKTGLVEIADTVGKIRKHFEYRSKDTEIRKLHRILGKTVLAFSDCIVTSVSVESTIVHSEGLFDALGSELWDIAYSQVRCIHEGYFLRGGVDIGYWYYAKDLLVSPAMIKAYDEERLRACHPIIAASNQLYNLLQKHPGRKAYSKDVDPFPDQFSSFKHPVSGNRVRFINYLRLMAQSLDWQYDRATYQTYMAAPRESEERDKIMSEGYERSLLDFFQRHKALIISAHSAAANEKVKAKCRFLVDYHNKELRLFLPTRNDIRVTL
jgi:hypothetical protein